MKITLKIFLLLIFILSGCESTEEPAETNSFEISDEPKSFKINIDADSLQVQQSPVYTVDYSDSELSGTNLSNIKYYYPKSGTNEVNKEFIVAEGDSFKIQINNCPANYPWKIDNNATDFFADGWTNDEILLLRKDSTFINDNTINREYVFKALKKGKGYICMIETDSAGTASSLFSHGLLIGYNCQPLSQIQLNISEIKWTYNKEENLFSTVSVKMKGTTNVYRLRGITHGDGIITAMEVRINSDSSFEIEYTVAFSHVSGLILKSNSELVLYGTVGLPRIITLINPQNK